MKGVDILKFLLSFVVVWIHTGTTGETLCGLTGIAVPCFFFFSGFFLFGKLFGEVSHSGRTRVLLSWLKGTFKMYFIWSIIYLPYAFYGFISEGTPLVKAAAIWVRNFLFVGESYLSWPLWYLLGMIQAGLIILLALKLRARLWHICLVAAVMAILPHAFNFTPVNNGIFLGFPMMMSGAIVRKLFPGLSPWAPGTAMHRTALFLRLMSVHIYLTHMLWAGGGIILCESFAVRGGQFWAVVSIMAVVTGIIVSFFPGVQKFLYGRQYVDPYRK